MASTVAAPHPGDSGSSKPTCPCCPGPTSGPCSFSRDFHHFPGAMSCFSSSCFPVGLAALPTPRTFAWLVQDVGLQGRMCSPRSLAQVSNPLGPSCPLQTRQMLRDSDTTRETPCCRCTHGHRHRHSSIPVGVHTHTVPGCPGAMYTEPVLTPCPCSHHVHAHTVTMLSPHQALLHTPHPKKAPPTQSLALQQGKEEGTPPWATNSVGLDVYSSPSMHPTSTHAPLSIYVTPPWPHECCLCCRVNLVLQEPGKNRLGIKLA